MDAGRLRAGTSGFSYPAWTPRFYPPELASEGYLAHYASRLAACELNNTFYRRPSAALLRRWRAATPEGFRFSVKAQGGGSRRAMGPDAGGAVRWLTEDLDALGDRLGAVLVRVPETVERDDDRLAALLGAWPAAIPLVMELQHPSWHVDETFGALRAAGAALCATELDDRPAPDLRVTGPFLYLRLRRAEYDRGAIDAWAARLVPFLASGMDAFAFFRHDEIGLAPGHALALEAAVAARLAAEG
jgi:uncharacterized protein YecE (DUF72 family)